MFRGTGAFFGEGCVCAHWGIDICIFAHAVLLFIYELTFGGVCIMRSGMSSGYALYESPRGLLTTSSNQTGPLLAPLRVKAQIAGAEM